jgi:hypothetical protein
MQAVGSAGLPTKRRGQDSAVMRRPGHAQLSISFEPLRVPRARACRPIPLARDLALLLIARVGAALSDTRTESASGAIRANEIRVTALTPEGALSDRRWGRVPLAEIEGRPRCRVIAVGLPGRVAMQVNR